MSELEKKQYLDLNLWLPGDILLKADKMSMAHSLELRVPFLDREVWALAAALPAAAKADAHTTKIALRRAAARTLPAASAARFSGLTRASAIMQSVTVTLALKPKFV